MDIFGFSKTYDNKTVLTFPDFSLKQGKIYAVIGANGCGKSTLAKIISGTLQPDDRKKPVISAGCTIGYLPQKPYAFHMTLLQNLMINAAGDGEDNASKAIALMEALDLTHLSNKKAASLSGGETARMALARLLMKDYSLLILDEPCAAMDIGSILAAEKLIRESCTSTECTVILITHSLQQAIRVSDEVLFLSDGKLVEYGPSERVLKNPTNEKTINYLKFYGADLGK